MANYYIRFYRVTFEEDENYIIENISDLNMRNPLNMEDFSDKIALEYSPEINIFNKATPSLNYSLRVQNSLSDSQIEKLQNNYFNFAIIKNADRTHEWFYFIRSVEVLTPSTAIVNLRMDTLNTYQSFILNTDNYDERTLIIRQHEDRFIDNNSNESIIHAEAQIDRINENIEVPLYRTSVTEKKLTNYQWFLVYRTRDDLTPDNITNPVECFLTSNYAFTIANTGSQVRKKYMWYDLDPLKSNNIFLKSSGELKVQMWNKGVVMGSFTIPEGANLTNLEWTKGSTRYWVTIYRKDTADSNFTQVGVLDDIYERPTTPSDVEIELIMDISDSTYYYYVSPDVLPEDKNTITVPWLIENGTEVRWHVAGEPLKTIDEIDRTDGRLMKIIECPEAPINLSISGSTLKITDNNASFNSTDKLIYINNIAKEFNLIDLGYIDLPISECVYSMESPTFTKLEELNMHEPKLFHSDFYMDKLVYSADAVIYEWENNLTSLRNPLVHIKYKQTNTINSNFIISFQTTAANYQITTDFGQLAVINRNNELPIFTNGYVDYIRTGYNYDKANIEISKKQALRNNVFSLGLNETKSILTNNPIRASLSGVSSVNEFLNTFDDYKKQKNNLESKLSTLAYQSTHVTGSNDLDLLNYYNSNGKVLHIHYEPLQMIIDQLDRLFYYYGYYRNVCGIPNWQSRSLFNFVQCNAKWKWNQSEENKLDPIDKTIRDDITEKLRVGVTAIHYVITRYPSGGAGIISAPMRAYQYPLYKTHDEWLLTPGRNNFERWIKDCFVKRD